MQRFDTAIGQWFFKFIFKLQGFFVLKHGVPVFQFRMFPDEFRSQPKCMQSIFHFVNGIFYRS